MEKAKRYSRKREAILNCIRKTDTHPDAEWVYNSLKSEYPGLSLGTVYRNIAEFKASGEIISVGTVGGSERLDGCTKPHGHLICRVCGRVMDMPKNYSVSLPELSGFTAERCDVAIHGVCENCVHRTKGA